MIIRLQPELSEAQITHIAKSTAELGYKATEVRTQYNHFLVAPGKKEIDLRRIGTLPGVADVYFVSDDYQLVSRQWRVQPTVIDLGGGAVIEKGGFSLMAGPCSIENEDQVRAILGHLQAQGIRMMRGGVFKPRSSPYAFRGLGIPGLEMWRKLCDEYGIKIVTEVMQVSQIAEMLPYVDVFQVGARNTQNFNLLDELGKVDKPVMLKRGISGTIDELLYSAEYIFSGGNEKVILCERGIRTYEHAYRNCLDVNAIALLKEKTHLPVIADPSHGIGIRDFVEPVGLAALLAGADGLIYEIHPVPEKAASDGQQTLNFAQSATFARKASALAAVKQAWV
jgi:3-deoxy-7-phosphoheptulonate synthase